MTPADNASGNKTKCKNQLSRELAYMGTTPNILVQLKQVALSEHIPA